MREYEYIAIAIIYSKAEVCVAEAGACICAWRKSECMEETSMVRSLDVALNGICLLFWTSCREIIEIHPND